MSVKTLHTFTDAELQLIEQALRIANERYRDLARVFRREGATLLSQRFDRFADEAGELAMKIETGR